jgi:type II secretory pathway component PulK
MKADPRTVRARQAGGDEKGAVLLLLVFLVAFSCLFVGTILRSLASDLQIVNNLLSSTKALHVAEAGIDHAISNLRSDRDWDTGLSQVDFPAGEGSQYTVVVANQAPVVIITSSGFVNGFSRTIEVRIFVAGESSPHPVRVMNWKEV